MELDALAGAAESIAQHRPAVLVESIKAGAAALREWLTARGYRIFEVGINLLAVHRSDPILPHIHEADSVRLKGLRLSARGS